MTSERGVASGVRRIEALAGERADVFRRAQESQLAEVESELGVSWQQSADEVRSLKERLKASEKSWPTSRMKLVSARFDRFRRRGGDRGCGSASRSQAGAGGSDSRTEKSGRRLRSRLGSGVVVLGAAAEGKLSLLVTVSEDLTERLNAGQLARAMGDAVGGSGGGRKDFAQAGGKGDDPTGAFRCSEAVRSIAIGVPGMISRHKATPVLLLGVGLVMSLVPSLGGADPLRPSR